MKKVSLSALVKRLAVNWSKNIIITAAVALIKFLIPSNPMPLLKSSSETMNGTWQRSTKCHVTYLPTRTAPAISKMVAKMQACLNVRTLEPTDVPNELATSLAPKPNAKRNETMKATIRIHSTSGLSGVNIIQGAEVLLELLNAKLVVTVNKKRTTNQFNDIFFSVSLSIKISQWITFQRLIALKTTHPHFLSVRRQLLIKYLWGLPLVVVARHR